jgi:DNA-binding IclR family transcriptional regulator
MKATRTTKAAKARDTSAPRGRAAANVTELPVAERPGTEKTTESGALTRGLTVLSAVIAAARPLTLIEIGETVGLSSSTCHRLLQTLTQAGYIYRDANSRYYPTPRAVCPLAIDHPLNLLRRDTGDTLKTLQHEYGASAGLIVFMGTTRLYVDIVLGRDNVAPYYETQHLTPFHCTVSGKLLLSELPVAGRDALLGAAPYASRTPQTITERGTLMRDLDQIAATGISSNFNENILGISAVGARLALPHERAIGVIVLTGPSKYFTKPRVAAMRRDLLEATTILSNTSLAVRAVARFLNI